MKIYKILALYSHQIFNSYPKVRASGASAKAQAGPKVQHTIKFWVFIFSIVELRITVKQKV
jgi:hypothetical protein